MNSENQELLTDAQRKQQIKAVQKKSIIVLTPGIIAYIVFVLVRTSGGTIASQLVRELGWTAAQVAMFTSMFSYVYSFANLPGGIITDILGARKTMSASYILIAVGCVIMGISNSYGLMLLARALMGLGGAVVYSGLSKVSVAWVRNRNYPGYNAKVMAISKIGTLYAATPLALMISTMGRKNALMIIAGVAVAITAAIIILMKDSPEECGMKSVDELEGNTAPTSKKAQNPLKGVGKLLLQPQVWFVVIASVSFNAAINTVVTNFGKTMLEQAGGMESVAAANIILINTFAGIVSGILLGSFLKLKFATNKIATYISFAMFGAALIMLGFFFPSLGTAGFSAVYLLIGFAASFEVSAIFAILRNMVTNKNYGTGVGLINFAAWLVGTSVCTTIWGFIVDEAYSIASFQNAVRFQLVYLLIGFVCFLFVKDKTLPAFEEN